MKYQRRSLGRNKTYRGIHDSQINENLDGGKPKDKWQHNHAEYGMAQGPPLPSTTFGGNEPGLHHSSETKIWLQLSFPISWFPFKLMPTWELNTRAAFGVFCSREWKSKAESTVSLFREDGLISWRDIKTEWLLTHNYSTLFKPEKPRSMPLSSFHSVFTRYFKNLSDVHISLAIPVSPGLWSKWTSLKIT